MLDGMSDSIQQSRIENLHSREVDRQSPMGLIFLYKLNISFIRTLILTIVYTVGMMRVCHLANLYHILHFSVIAVKCEKSVKDLAACLKFIHGTDTGTCT